MSFSGSISFFGLGYRRARSQDVDSISEYESDDHRMSGGLYQSDLDISISHDVDHDYDSSGRSSESEHITSKITHLRTATSLGTKIKKIKDRTSRAALLKKKRVKDNKSLKDWWSWYWQKPVDRFRFLYYFLLLLSCFAFSVFWFMDNDSAFILCGFTGLSMCGYAMYKFKQAMELKKGIDHYKQLNYKLRKETKALEHTVNRIINAHNLLEQTKHRLSKANARNKKNLHKFEQVEANMMLVGQQAKGNLGVVNQMTHEIKSKWREEFLSSERGMLHAVFDRYGSNRYDHNKSKLGLTEDDFKEFQSMLPRRYQERFERLGTFHNFAGTKSMIDPDDFNATLDTFALMETDSRDIEFLVTPSFKPVAAPQHHRQVHWKSNTDDIASFSFTTRELIRGSSGSLIRQNSNSLAMSPRMLSPRMQRSPSKGEKYVHFRQHK